MAFVEIRSNNNLYTFGPFNGREEIKNYFKDMIALTQPDIIGLDDGQIDLDLLNQNSEKCVKTIIYFTAD